MKYETGQKVIRIGLAIAIIFFFIIYGIDCFSQILIYDGSDITGQEVLDDAEINNLIDELIELEKIDDSEQGKP